MPGRSRQILSPNRWIKGADHLGLGGASHTKPLIFAARPPCNSA
jgi:hypothetical protein